MTLFHNPLCPSLKIDHLIVPQLEFGVFSTNSVFEYKADENSNEIKSVNAKNFINKEIYSENKNKIGFYKKITKALLETVICDLSEIKTMHDSLEKYYINAMNYESLDKFTDNFIDKMQKIYC